jgi:hypothetical protein
MAINVFNHYEAELDAGILDVVSDNATNRAWGNNALQTVTIARQFPRDPQQAIGLRGVVDYTSGVQTTDLTLDCILTEDTVAAVDGTSGSGTSIYRHAENTVTVGVESYVLTSCSVGFTAGSPATVSYGWITAGTGSALSEASSSPDVLKDGQEAYFAIVLGDDGSGIGLLGKDSVGTWTAGVVAPSGVQSLNFSANVNRDQVLDIRAAQPVQFITTYPIDITIDIESYDNANVGGTTNFDKDSNAGNLTSIGVTLAGLSNHADRTGYSAPSRAPFTNYAASTKDLVLASGLVKINETESLNVGGYVTYSYNYTASDIAVPLAYFTPA